MLRFLFTVVEGPSTAFEAVNDSRSVHFTVNGNTFTSSPLSFVSENAYEPDLRDLSSYDTGSVNFLPSSISL